VFGLFRRSLLTHPSFRQLIDFNLEIIVIHVSATLALAMTWPTRLTACLVPGLRRHQGIIQVSGPDKPAPRKTDVKRSSTIDMISDLTVDTFEAAI
jgi:hypothetical protein